MGDISELRGLLVVGSFLAITVLLIAWIPSEFYVAGQTRTLNIPPEFDAIDLVNYAATHNFTLDDDVWEDWGKPTFGHDMTFLASYYDMANIHSYGFFEAHKMHWFNKNGVDRGDVLDIDEINADWDSGVNMASYKVQCNHFYMYAFISYNTSYPSLKVAWDDAKAYILFAIDFAQKGSAWSAWSLITGILFFKLPFIDPYTNAMIAIPLWIAMAYIAYILVLRAIGAIFGGGA